MKSLNILIGFGLILSLSLFAESPQLVKVALQQGFVPIGFDDNDRTQVTVAGVFPNSCYKVASYKTRIDVAAQTIYVQQEANYYPGICLKILVPFSQVVDLGILREGAYTLKDEFSGKVLGKLPVSRAKGPEADDFLYAPITDAYVRVEEGKNVLHLNGTFTDRCTKLKEVRVGYYENVIVVLPIAEHLESRECEPQMLRFQYESPIKEELKGNWLLHVRAMNGQAVNRVTEFPDMVP